MKSEIFYTNAFKNIEAKIQTFLNGYPDFLSKDTVSSTRATGDAIQHILEENFKDILGNFCKNYFAGFPRKAMADLAFTDSKGLYYAVNVKSLRLEPGFHMPNLVSVRKLAKFYEEEKNCYVILMVTYEVSNISIRVDKVYFVPIEFLSWSCLTIGALGWGQIQIANANNIVVNHKYSRKRWMLELCDVLLNFYPREIEKVKGQRISYFKKVKNHWESKKDI